ncbi:hypothetical protein ACWCSD_46825 [Nonomuraea sp. NPDC001684]
MPEQEEVTALLALFLLQHSRRDARREPGSAATGSTPTRSCASGPPATRPWPSTASATTGTPPSPRASATCCAA